MKTTATTRLGHATEPTAERRAAASDVRLVRIGDLARDLGQTTRALRYWEERGLLPPARRTSGGMRVYGPEHVQAARGVVRLKSAGFSLDEICEIQQHLGMRRTALDGMRMVAVVLADREERIRARIREQQTLLEELEASRSTVGLCDGCSGKTYDATCIDCLEDRGRSSMPACLRTVLEAAAATRGTPPSAELPPNGRTR